MIARWEAATPHQAYPNGPYFFFFLVAFFFVAIRPSPPPQTAVIDPLGSCVSASEPHRLAAEVLRLLSTSPFVLHEIHVQLR